VRPRGQEHVSLWELHPGNGAERWGGKDDNGMTIIYVLTDGSYSDYHIEAVCSTKEIADQLHDKTGWDIDEFTLDNYSDALKPGYKNYIVYMERNGNSTVKEILSLVSNEKDYKLFEKQMKYLGDGHYDIIQKSSMQFYIATKSETHAVKIANELRAQLIANGEWKASRDD
jgi:hypothetical protein